MSNQQAAIQVHHLYVVVQNKCIVEHLALVIHFKLYFITFCVITAKMLTSIIGKREHFEPFVNAKPNAVTANCCRCFKNKKWKNGPKTVQTTFAFQQFQQQSSLSLSMWESESTQAHSASARWRSIGRWGGG